MTERVLCVVNPASAGGKTAKRFAQAKETLLHRLPHLDVLLTHGPRHATSLVRNAIASGTRTVLSVGGDGTHNEVLNGFIDEQGNLLRPDARLALFTSGTGGDLSRSVDKSPTLAVLADRIAGGDGRLVDMGIVRFADPDGRRILRAFLNIASAGLSGETDRIVNASSKALGGKLSFALGAMRAFAAHVPAPIDLVLDDAPPERLLPQLLAVAKGSYFGGGMRIAPDARLDDGMFSIVTVDALPWTDWVRHGLKVYQGRHLGLEGVRAFRAKTVHALPVGETPPILLDIDGEQPGRLPASFSLYPHALSLVA